MDMDWVIATIILVGVAAIGGIAYRQFRIGKEYKRLSPSRSSRLSGRQ